MDSKRNNVTLNSQTNREKRHQMAKELSDRAVIALDTRLRTEKDIIAVFREFEALKGDKPKSDPKLLLAWARMQWIKLELTQQAHQHAGIDSMHTAINATSIKDQKLQNDALDAPTLPNSIARAIQEDAHTGVPITKSIAKLGQLMLQIVGTEHPTDPLAQEPRNLLRAIATHDSDTALVETLEKLHASEQPIPPTQRTVIEEVLRNIHMMLDPLYDSLPLFILTILKAYEMHYGAAAFKQYEEHIWQAIENTTDALGEARQLVKHGYWPGFDADGNHNVTPTAGREASAIYRAHASDKHHATLAELIKNIPNNSSSDALLKQLHQLQSKLNAYKTAVTTGKFKLRTADEKALVASGKKPMTPTEEIVAEFDQVVATHHVFLEKNTLVKLGLRLFGMQLRCFGLTYGFGHIRQDSSVFAEAWNDLFNEMKRDPVSTNAPIFQHFNNKLYCELDEQKRIAIHSELNNGSTTSNAFLDAIQKKFLAKQFTHATTIRELDRMALSAENFDMIENIIISNTTSASAILGVRSLQSVFIRQPHPITIVPLLETREDLLNYEAILRNYIAACPVKPKALEVMFGFSDTERVSGLSALQTMQVTQEKFILLARELKLEPRFYFGPGGDPNRGGLKKRLPKATLQGNARSMMLSTTAHTLRYCETLFHTAHHRLSHPELRLEFTKLPSHLQIAFATAEKEGAMFYEQLHDTKNGLGKLFGLMQGHGSHWFVDILNSSSRASQRQADVKQINRAARVLRGSTHNRPAKYIDLNKQRAITAAQTKEVLRDYINIIIGPGHAFRKLGLEKTIALYNASETVRDIVAKSLLGLSMVDLRVTAYALFGDDTTLLAADDRTRKLWAAECLALQELLKKSTVDELLKDEKGLKHKLSRLFAFIENEYRESYQFFLKLNACIHNKPQTMQTILDCHPEWKAETDAVLHDLNPVSMLLARINYLVHSGHNLDEIYPGINITQLLGYIGNAVTAARIMPFHYYETLDLTTHLRTGVTRAHADELALRSTRDEKAFPAAKVIVEAMLKNMLLKKKVTNKVAGTAATPKAADNLAKSGL